MEEDTSNVSPNNRVNDFDGQENYSRNGSAVNHNTSSHSNEDEEARDEFLDSLIDAELGNPASPETNGHISENTLIVAAESESVSANTDEVAVEALNNSHLPDESVNSSTEINETVNHEVDELPDSAPNDSGFVKPKDVLCHFPLGRIKRIVKSDPEVPVISAESLFLISKATELFLRWLGKEVHAFTVQQKKKTIQVRDLNSAISELPALEFLDGALD